MSCEDEDFPAGKPFVGVLDPDYHGTDVSQMYKIFPCSWGQNASEWVWPRNDTSRPLDQYGYERALMNFDSFLQATVSVFVISSLADITDVVHNAMDSSGEGLQPELNASPQAFW